MRLGIRSATVGVFLLALAARLLFQAGYVGWNSPPQDDAVQYDTIAWNLANGAPFQAPDGYLSHRAPAYPYLLAGLYKTCGHSWPMARVLQALIGATTAVVILHLGSGSIAPRVRGVASVAYAVFPYSVYWSGYLLSEPLCVLLTALSIHALLRDARSLSWNVLWAFFCGMGVLTRPNMALLFIAGLFWISSRGERRVTRCLIASLVFVLTLVPWTLRNYSVHHRLVAVTTMGGVVLWESNNPYTSRDPEMRGRSGHAPDLPGADQARGLTEAEADQVYFRLARDFILNNWDEMPRLLAYKMLRLWQPFPSLESARSSAVASIAIIPALLMFAFGLCLAWSRREPWLMPVMIPVIVVTLTALIYWGDARIRAPAEPSIMILAAYSLDFILERRKGPLKASAT